MSHDISSSSVRRPLKIGILVLLLAVPVTGALISFYDLVRDGVGGVDGIGGVVDIEFSADGKLFAVGRDDNSLVVFDAGPDGLVFVNKYEDGVDGIFGLLGVSGVAASPDGRHVYVTAEIDDTLAVFSRDATSDALNFIAGEVKENGVGSVFGLDGAAAVTVSGDDEFVIVAARADDAVTVFSRDATSDQLAFVDVEFDGLAPLRGASGVAISPDSRHVYVTAEIDDALVLFERDTPGPGITYVSHFQDDEITDGLDGASGVAVSPDGKSVYVTGKIDNALSVFDRDSVTGALSPRATYREGVDGITGLHGPSAVAVHSSGHWVFVTSRYGNSMALFVRNRYNGELTLDTVVVDGIDGVDGLGGAIALASSYERAYAAGHDDDAIVTFDLDTSALPFFEDGFESGDTSAWSFVVP